MQYKLRKLYTKNPESALRAILIDRGVHDIDAFIMPSKDCELNPYDLENIDAGADMLLEHLQKNHRILWILDCDVDGVTSGSILWLYCKRIYPDAQFEFRVHDHKQHGLEDMIDWVEDKNKWDLIIVTDAGSYDVEEHHRINELGMDCLIIDHHDLSYDENGNPIVSDAPRTIIINNQLSPNYANKSLCGAGMVYKFCEVLDKKLDISIAHEYIDLAALGEIADVMDRRFSETNYIMLEGLKHIKNKGFKTLIESQQYSLKEKAFYPYNGLTPIDVAFYIAPLINALIRVGTLEEKRELFYCFVEPDREVPSTKRGAKEGDTELAAPHIARVGANAKSRQNSIKTKAMDLIDFRIQKEALDQNNIIIVEVEESDGIPQELTGLVAMAVVSKYNKPCLMVRRNKQNVLQGSLRNNGNFSALPNLKQCLTDSGFFDYVAGHDNAGGVGIQGKKVDSFVKWMNEKFKPQDFENCYLVDYILDANDYDNKELLFALAYSPEYFGNHIDEIKIVIENIPLAQVMPMGTNKDSMKITYNGIDYVRFKDPEFVKKIMENRAATLTVYGRANINVFNNRTSIQVFCDDYELKNDDDHKYDF